MNRMKSGWKKLIVMLLLIPIMAFFPACGGGGGGQSQPTLTPTNTTYTIHFVTNSAETFNIPNQHIKYGGLITKPETPTKHGYSFVGWYTDTEFTRVWLFESDIVTKGMTLYARWDKRI